MVNVVIYLKSGAQIKAAVESFHAAYSPQSGELIRIEHQGLKPKLLYINLSDVSAITGDER